ncbi:MAG: hypothetical protein JO232_13160 [Verrucomicrobia bacterium]|nr:hypothetical protein [Verrucomicrobiota bacterium]
MPVPSLQIARYVTPRYRLRIGAFIDPRWFARYARVHFDCSVDMNGAIALGSETLEPEETGAFHPGERIIVFCDRWFYGVRYSDTLSHQETLEREPAQRLEKEERSRELSMLEAKSFSRQICIPANWDIAIRDVLSGLTESSRGDGRNAKTVEHILLLGPLAAGRLKRDKGDLLCASNRKLNGKNWSGHRIERGVGPNGEEYRPTVTCKKCLQLARRWITGRAS